MSQKGLFDNVTASPVDAIVRDDPATALTYWRCPECRQTFETEDQDVWGADPGCVFCAGCGAHLRPKRDEECSIKPATTA